MTSFPNESKQRMLRRKEAAKYLTEKRGVPIAAQTLAKLASIGGGPPFRKFGRFPLYVLGDLDDWVNNRLSAKQRSTSDTIEVA